MVLLGEHRFDFRTDRDVEAREPDLRADEVDVQRVGERVDEAADQEERRELGKERCRELLLSRDEEAADGEDGGFPRIILRRLDALDPARTREAELLDGDDEAADGEDGGFPGVVLRGLDALDPARTREAELLDGARRLGRAADLGLVAVGRERGQALEGDDGQEDGVDG